MSKQVLIKTSSSEYELDLDDVTVLVANGELCVYDKRVKYPARNEVVNVKTTDILLLQIKGV